jgi:hypothetical protein
VPQACPSESSGEVSANKVSKFLTRHHREDTNVGRKLLSAAAVADDWRLDSALARDGAKERYAGAHDW